MVEIQAKSGATYLNAYRQLVERTKTFDQSAVDNDSNAGQVEVDQVVQTGPGMSTESTRLILKGNLQSGPVLAPSGAISLESIPCEQYARNPATKLEFRPSGGKLQVEEQYFEADSAQGQKRTFTIDFASGAVSNIKEEAASRVVPGSLDQALQSQLDGMGRDMSSLGYTIGSSRFQS